MTTIGIVKIVVYSLEDAAARKWSCNKRYNVLKEGTKEGTKGTRYSALRR